MSRTKNTLLIILLFISNTIEAQIVDSEKTIKKINNTVIHFLIQKGQLEKGQSFEKFLEQITIIEVFKRETLGCQENGIYLFRACFAPTITYLLLKQKSKVKILDPYQFSKTLKEVLRFLEKQNTASNDIIKYLEEVIKVYKMNRYDSKYRL